MYPQLQQFLKQGMHEAVDWQASVDGLQTLMQQPLPRTGQQQPMVVNSF
jgi:hypothetical protein